jgi:hypothetical protein
MAERIKIRQKDFDHVKRRVEEAVILFGGSFSDAKTGNRVKSRYTYHANTAQYVWHQTYSPGSLKKCASGAQRMLRYELKFPEKIKIKSIGRSSSSNASNDHAEEVKLLEAYGAILLELHEIQTD